MENPENWEGKELTLFDLLNIMVIRAEQKAIEEQLRALPQAQPERTGPLVLKLTRKDVELLKEMHISIEGDNR